MQDAVDDHGRVASGVLALAVHLVFFTLLVFGISWQKKITVPVMVDLWEELPPSRVDALPRPEPKPAPPEPKPKVVPPPPKVEAPPQPTQAEIELKERQRKQREEEARLLEEQKRIEAEKRRLEDEERKRVEAENRRLEEEARKRDQAIKLAEELRKEEETARKEQFRREEEAKEAKRRQEEERLRAAAAEEQRRRDDAARKQREAEEARRRAEADARAAQKNLIDSYMARIQAKVIPKIVMPSDLKGKPQGVFEVTLLPGGDVLELKLTRSSGVPAYDAAVERAIHAAAPLPVPADSDLFQQNFRRFSFTFKPQD